MGGGGGLVGSWALLGAGLGAAAGDRCGFGTQAWKTILECDRRQHKP